MISMAIGEYRGRSDNRPAGRERGREEGKGEEESYIIEEQDTGRRDE